MILWYRSELLLPWGEKCVAWVVKWVVSIAFLCKLVSWKETCTLSRWSSSTRGCWGSWESSTLAGGCLEGKLRVWRDRWSRRCCDEERWGISWHSYWTVSCRSCGWRWERSRPCRRASEREWGRAPGFLDCWLRVRPRSGINTSNNSMSWRGRYVSVCFYLCLKKNPLQTKMWFINAFQLIKI